jgi:Reversibly glycosylated polypeptide
VFDVVITTIGDGAFLKPWRELIENEGLRDDLRLVIIPDVNTPASLYGAAEELSRAGIMVLCPTPPQQEEFLRKLGARPGFIPSCSDNRRNIGYLMSWQDEAEAIVSADDDNTPLNGQWLVGHQAVVEGPARYTMVSSSTGWFNPCSLLDTRPAIIWPRGFPYFARTASEVTHAYGMADVGINAGLWLGDPDVDAITRLGARPVVITQKGASVTLAPGTWMPVNSQNTAVRWDLIPAYYFARMGTFGGRYGDIFSGYFAQACAARLGYSVRAGVPLVMQNRNQHDLMRDLELEFPFTRMFDQLLQWLTGPELELTGSSARDVYESLSYALHDAAETFTCDVEKGVLHRLAYHMRYWLTLCDQIGRL